MHFYTFVIIGSEGDTETLVDRALAPFSDDLAVPQYRRYLDRYEVEHMANHYGIEKNNLHALLKKMKDWTGNEGGIDGQRLYHLATYNPNGRWDWYEVGGRWDHYIKGSKRNVISARALLKSSRLKDCLPYHVLTPDGTWLEHERFIANGSLVGRLERKTDDAWLREVREALERYIDRRVVCVDIHR